MANWLTGLLDRVFVVAGALIFAQMPMYMQQYGTQLIGRVAELKLQVDGMIKAATYGSRSLHTYIQRFIDSGDSDFSRQGELMMGTVDRYDQLLQASQSLQSASWVTKPFIFVRDFNWEVARTAIQDFHPGIPVSFEGLIYGALGIAFGYGLFSLICILMRFLFRPFRSIAS